MSLNKIYLLCFFVAGSCLTTEAFAVSCEPLTGTPYISRITVSDLNIRNEVGGYKNMEASRIPTLYKIKPGCTAQGSRLYFTSVMGAGMTYAGDFMINIGTGRYYNIPNNDYIMVNLSSNVGGMYMTEIPQVAETNRCATTLDSNCRDKPEQNALYSASRFYINARVKKKMVGSVYIPETILVDYYATTTPTDALTIPVTRLVFGGNITVPESCAFNVGDVIEFNFGNLTASSFVDAGVGLPLNGVNIQSKSMSMTCKGMVAGQLISARVTAPSVKGNMLLSDNPDVGFQVADQNSKILIPNDSTSVIPLKLDNNLKSNFMLKAWPVSPTGKKPNGGPVVSMANVTLDFR